jgi:hypothetical protein
MWSNYAFLLTFCTTINSCSFFFSTLILRLGLPVTELRQQRSARLLSLCWYNPYFSDQADLGTLLKPKIFSILLGTQCEILPALRLGRRVIASEVDEKVWKEGMEILRSEIKVRLWIYFHIIYIIIYLFYFSLLSGALSKRYRYFPAQRWCSHHVRYLHEDSRVHILYAQYTDIDITFLINDTMSSMIPYM